MIAFLVVYVLGGAAMFGFASAFSEPEEIWPLVPWSVVWPLWLVITIVVLVFGGDE